MKNICLLFALVSFISCKEEKLKKIVINTNQQCRKADSRDYRVGQPRVSMLKSKLLKPNPLKKFQ